ncbi:Cryptochrome DASH [Chlorella vulgaris]
MSAAMAAPRGGKGAAAARPAALVWFRSDLRVTDHEPLFRAAADLQSALEQHGALLLPFFCLDSRELAPRAGEAAAGGGTVLGIPQLGPHRLRLLLEGCASLRTSLQQLGSNLLWQQGSPEALVGRLVALAAAAGTTRLALHHHTQPGAEALGIEGKVAAAFAAAAAAHGNVHTYWGATLYHPEDLPWQLWLPDSDGGGGTGTGSTSSRLPGTSSSRSGTADASSNGVDGSREGFQQEEWQQRCICLPGVMSDFRKAVQAHAPVRPPFPAPRHAESSSSSSSSPAMPPLPASFAAAAEDAGLLASLPTYLCRVYAAAGDEAVAALSSWEALTGVACAELAPVCSAQHDARSALPFTMGEQQAQQRLRYYLGLVDSDGHRLRAAGQPPPIAGYGQSRMQAFGVDHSAKLSAFLALGCLSPRMVHAAVMELAAAEHAPEQQARGGSGSSGAAADAAHEVANGVAELKLSERQGQAVAEWREPTAADSWRWLLMHLGIRDFFIYNHLKEGPAPTRLNGSSHTSAEWRQDPELFGRWVQGQTGLPFVDACMRELAATGYTSNRGRQNVASLLAKALRIDWRLGLRYFESTLADHDCSANLGNWAYNAGTGADPRDRTFKTVTQGLRYDPDARLIRAWVPQLAALSPPELAHQPWAAPLEALAAAGVQLRPWQQGAAAEAESGTGGWYPLPAVDPATQTGKGPKKQQQQQQQAASAQPLAQE